MNGNKELLKALVCGNNICNFVEKAMFFIVGYCIGSIAHTTITLLPEQETENNSEE